MGTSHLHDSPEGGATSLALVALVALIILSPPDAAAQTAKSPLKPDAAPAGNAEKGKQAFTSHGCNACHGAAGEGSPQPFAGGPPIGPPPISYAAFARYVRLPTGQMPPFNVQKVPDPELADIYAFLQAQPARADEAAPAGNAQNGKQLYVRYGCYECHGRVGQGATQTGGSQIGPPPIPFSWFSRYVRHPAGQMPPYTAKVVPDAELADIYAFLMSVPVPPDAKDIPLLNQCRRVRRAPGEGSNAARTLGALRRQTPPPTFRAPLRTSASAQTAFRVGPRHSRSRRSSPLRKCGPEDRNSDG
jgi:mono/diheme cytochrome c family protein